MAEKLAKLRTIPPNLLPSSLKHKIELPKITEIRLDYNRFAKEFGPMFQFYRLYVADIRMNNPHLKIHRNVSDEGPLVGKVVIKREGQEEDIVIEGMKMKTAQELKDKILEIHNEML